MRPNLNQSANAENPFADLGATETENPFADLGAVPVEEEPKKKSTETTPAAKEAGAGSFKLSPEFVTADSPYAAFQSELKTKAQELEAAMNQPEITFNVTPEQNKSFVKAMANMPDALVDSEDAKLSFVANFSKKTGASKKNLISLWNQTKNNKRRLEALESEYLMAPELVFQDVPGVGAGVVLSGRQVKLESPVAGGVMGSYAGVVQGAEQPAPPDVSVQQKAPKTFEQESMDLYELASLYNYFGDHEKAKEAFYLLEGKLKQQAEQELQDKDFAARAPKNYIEQRQAPATQGLAYTAYVSGDRAESKRITDILESKGLLEKKPELAAVGAGDVLQPSYTAPKYGFTGKQGFEYTLEEGVREASRPTPESEYLNQIQEGIVQTSTIGPMAQMAEHGVEKLGEGLKEVVIDPRLNPYYGTPKGYIKSTIKLVTGLAESVAGIAGMTTPQGAMAAIPFMQATTTMMPPEVAEWAMPTSKLVRNYYTDKGQPVPPWAENLAVLGDFALLGLLHKAGEGGAKRYKAKQETKRQAATLDEFFAEGIRPEEMERISKVVEKRWEDAGKDPVIYAEQVAERVNKEVKPELESMEAEVTEVPPYNPPPAPESLRTLTEGADVEMNGEVGNIERGDDGSWYFVNDKGESKQIPVADKFNPTEKLSELGIQVLPEISKADIARAAADAEMTGFVEYNGRRYFVSLDSTGKVNPVGDRVFEVRADGTMVDRFSSHPDPKFAADRMLAITNAFRESKGMPKRTKNITPWKESERYEVEGGTIAFEPETINAMGGKGQYLFYDAAGNPRVITEAEYARLRDGGKAIKVDGQYQPGYEGYEQGAGVMPEAKVEEVAPEGKAETKAVEQQVQDSLEIIKDLPSSNDVIEAKKIEGSFLTKKQASELQEQIEANYDTIPEFGQESNDIRKSLYNYDNPYAEKTINGVNLRVAEGLIEGEPNSRNRRKTWLLYANGEIVGKFYSPKDIMQAVKFIEDNLIKQEPEAPKVEVEAPPALRDVESTTKALEPIVNKRKESIGVKLRNLVGLITHNGPEVISKFDPTKIKGQTRGRYGKGFYFSSLFKNFDYGDKSTYLDSSKLNLLNGDMSVSEALNSLSFSKEVDGTIYKLKELLSKSKNNREYNEILDEIKRLEEKKSSFDKNEIYIQKALEKAVKENPNQDFGSLLENLESRVIEANRLNPSRAVEGLNESLNNLLLNSGFDGVSFTEGNEILIIPQEKLNDLIILSQEKAISEAYHKAKADGSNPELVKAVEELLGGEKAPAPEAPKVEAEAPKVEMEAPKVEVEVPKVEVEAEAPAPELEGNELVSMDYSVRNPKKNTIVFVDADAVLERHSKDQPAYDITKPENQIKGRVQKAKEFLLNYIKDQRSINPKTGERTKFNVKFEPSVASIENGKLGFEDGRHRILAAKELGLKTVAIEVPKDQAAMFKKEFAAKKPSEGGVPKAQDPRIQAKNDLLGLVDRYNTLPKRDRGTVGANLRGRIQKEATSLGLSLSANKSGRLILLDKSGRSVRKTAIKLSEEARALRKEQIDSYNNARQMPAMDVRHAIIQFFMGGGKISEAALDSTIGGSLKKDIPRGLVGKKGYAIDMLYELLSQTDPEIMFQIDEIDFVGSVGDVLMEFSNRGQMKDALLEYYSKSKDVTEFGSRAEYEAWLDYKEEMFREAAELGVNLEEVSTDSWRSAIEQERIMSDDAVNEFLADLDKNAPKTTEEINRLYEEHGVPEKEVSDISSAIQRETEAEFARIREEDATKQRAASEVERAESLREAEAELTAAEKNLQSERARVDKLRKESAQESMFPKPKEDVLFDERITLAGRQAELKAAENRVAVAKRRVEELRSAAPSEIAPEGSPLRNAIDELRKAKENFDRGIESPGFAYDPKKRAQDLYDLHQAYVKVAKEAIKEGVRTIEEFARVVSATTKGAVMAFEEAMGRKAKLTLQDFEKAKLSKDYNEPYVFKGKTTKGAIKAATEMPIAQDLKDLNVKMKAMAKAAIEGYKQGKREIREMWAAKNAQNRAFADQVNAQMQKLRGRIGSKTAQAIVKKALLANTPARMRAFERFAGRAIMNANYVAQVEAASSVRSRLKKLVSGKDAAKKLGANNVAIIKALAKIRPEDILDFDQYFDIAERVIESNQSMRYDKVEGGTTKARPRITNEEVANYLVEQDKFYENQLKQEVIAQHQDLIDMGIIDPDILSADDMLAIVESIENTEVPLTEELLAEMFDRQIAEVAARQGLDILSPDAGPDFDFAARENKRLTLQEKVLKAFQDTVKYAQMDLETYLVDEAAALTPRQIESINSLRNIDTALLSKDEAVMVNRAIQNIIYNNSFAGVDQVAGVISFNQQAVSKAGKITKNKPVREVGKITRIARSKDLALEKVFGNIDQAIEIKKASGIERLWNTVAEMKNRFSDYYDSTKNKTSFISMREALSKRDKRDYNDTRNRAIRGMYAKMIKNFGGSEIEIAKEFVRHKRQVLENIKAYLSAGGKVEIDAGGYIKADENNRPIFTETTAKLGAKSKALREEGELLLSIYNELFKDANNAAELRERIFNEGRGNVELVERAIEINRENRNAVFESAEMDQNKIDLDYQENYTRDKYKSITDTPIETADSVENLFNTVFSPRNVKDKASGSMNKVVRSDKSYVNQGRVLNFDFDNVFRDALYDDMFASATSKNINQLRQLFRNKESATVVFGSDTNAAYFKRMLMRSIDIMRNRRAPATDLQRSVVGTIGKISYDATRLALLGTSQIFKQFMGVANGSIISNGAVQAPRMLNYFARGFRHMNHPMLNEFNISQRGTILGGFFSEATDVISERGLIKKTVLSKVLDLRKSIGDAIAKPLGAGDAGVARSSWWMYYLDYLYKKGVDVNAIDFETIRPDYDAAAYAEQMVSRMQNANDRASMPDLYASGDPFLKIIRDVLLPFSSFSVNMNRRMANDIDILYNGTSSQKLQAYRSLQSAVVEQFVFNSMKVYLLGSATQAGADLLSDYFEISDDELEKVYKSAYGDTRKTKTEKVIWNSIEDIFLGALPAPVKSGIKEYVNKSYVALTGVDEEWQNGPFFVYRTTDDPDFPSWIDYLGVHGTYGKTIYDVGKMGEMAITGEYEAAEGAKVEMSDNEKKAVMAAALIDFAALLGVSDQDVSSINTKLKRQIKKHLGREYGKDIQITVPKKAATIADPFRDVDREVSAERFVRFWNDPETTDQERYNVIKQGVINKRTWTEKAGEGRVSFMDALKKLDRKAYIKVKLLKKKAEREVRMGQ